MTNDIFPQIEPMPFDEFNKTNYNKIITTYRSAFKETVYESSSLEEYVKSLEKQLECLNKFKGNKDCTFDVCIYEDGYDYYYEVQVHKKIEKELITPLEEVEKKYGEYLSNHEIANNQRKSDSERYRKHLVWLEENKNVSK